MKMQEMWAKMNLKSLSIDQGQRKVRSFPCCILSVCHFWWVVVFDHWSNGKYTPDLRRVLWVKERPVYLQKALLSRMNPILWHTLLPLILLALRRWLVPPSSDSWRLFTGFFNSAELRSFLLTMRTLAPESTTNSLSSGFTVDAAGKIHSSVAKRM